MTADSVNWSMYVTVISGQEPNHKPETYSNDSQPVDHNPLNIEWLFHRYCISDILNFRYLYYNL